MPTAAEEVFSSAIVVEMDVDDESTRRRELVEK